MKKKTNLALSADVTTSDELLKLVHTHGKNICILKTHIDMLIDFNLSLTIELNKLAKTYQFLIFEDRKFADIGYTVKQQYEQGIYHIADWADMINAHGLPGPGIVQALAEVGEKKGRGLILIAEMSSNSHLMDATYQQKVLNMARQFPAFVLGFITQHALSDEPQWINLTPGIQLEVGSDRLGQQYTTPAKAILDQGSDVIIVGRGITHANDPSIATSYREQAWTAYQQRINRRISRIQE